MSAATAASTSPLPRALRISGTISARAARVRSVAEIGEVKRADRVVVQGQNSDGEPISIEASGYLSRAFQHEIDHLNGILFTDLAISIYDISERQNKGSE